MKAPANMRRLFLATLLLAGISAAATLESRVVCWDGTLEDGLTVYRGIPFAAPPVGDLRWRAPQPATKWDGVKHADKFAPECIQGDCRSAVMSENCMYLNVWAPAKTANERIPVLVWI